MIGSQIIERAFGWETIPRGRVKAKMVSLLGRLMDRILVLDKIEQLRTKAAAGSRGDISARFLEALSVKIDLEESDLNLIPKSGPLIVVANHPFGMLDGVMLASILRSVRPDVRIMANFLLTTMPGADDYVIPVDPFDRRDSKSNNIKPLKQAIMFVRSGGALGVFPAGQVAHVDLRERRIKEAEWSESIAKLIRKTEALVLPIYFQGANGPLFHIAGLIHPALRTVRLPRELLNKHDKQVKVRVGQTVSPARLDSFGSDSEMIEYLKERTHLLGACLTDQRKAQERCDSFAPIADKQDTALLRAEITGLPPEQVLICSTPHLVCYATAGQIPAVLIEIGRLREITFRQAGEGSGKPLDLDEFDSHYLHLFVWNIETSEIIAAYRLAQTDKIISKMGVDGLYTASLFKFSDLFIERISPALELGRAFVRNEYQKTFWPLFLLWKGIAQFVTRNPRYRLMFGAVSIDDGYQPASRRLMIDFLTRNHSLSEQAALVCARSPLPVSASRYLSTVSSAIRDLTELSDVVADIERDRRSVPILIKQYLKLGGKFLGFNLDLKFANVVDGLILIDLAETERRVLERFLGPEETAKFLAFHRTTHRRLQENLPFQQDVCQPFLLTSPS